MPTTTKAPRFTAPRHYKADGTLEGDRWYVMDHASESVVFKWSGPKSKVKCEAVAATLNGMEE